MDLTYPEPTYIDEMVNEQMKKRIEELEAEREQLMETVDSLSKIVKQEKTEKEELRKKLYNREFVTATKIGNLYGRTEKSRRYQGVVVTAPIPYESPKKGANNDIKSYNWVYSNELGFVRSLNKSSIKMEMPHSVALRAVKAEQKRFHCKTEIVHGKIEFTIFFEFDSIILYSDDVVYLEDKFLNRIHLKTKLIGELFRLTGTSKIKGKIGIRARIMLKANFLEKFNNRPNDAIFEIVQILKVELEGGKVVNSR
ncbi:hypothetical protein CAEBREN_22889 [Caenorhabditis brenneri]|uniref:Uncharacterized protein n=1 Tax=Caenorhabditis brenneri TaxID=135651 RepID=G0NKV6_CAEBE|nr:hypothetical protein CAEBREN_22889 [Caenorhabditis brenneri]